MGDVSRREAGISLGSNGKNDRKKIGHSHSAKTGSIPRCVGSEAGFTQSKRLKSFSC